MAYAYANFIMPPQPRPCSPAHEPHALRLRRVRPPCSHAGRSSGPPTSHPQACNASSAATAAVPRQAHNASSAATAAVPRQAHNASSADTAAVPRQAHNASSAATAAVPRQAHNASSAATAAVPLPSQPASQASLAETLAGAAAGRHAWVVAGASVADPDLDKDADADADTDEEFSRSTSRDLGVARRSISNWLPKKYGDSLDFDVFGGGQASGSSSSSSSSSSGHTGSRHRARTAPAARRMQADPQAQAPHQHLHLNVPPPPPPGAHPDPRLAPPPDHRGWGGAGFTQPGSGCDMNLPENAPALTHAISSAFNLNKLLALCGRHLHAFNHLHVSCTLAKLVRLGPPDDMAQSKLLGELLADLDAASVRVLPSCTSRELVCNLWSWARLGHMCSDEAWGMLRAALLRPPCMLNAATPQALTNLAWALNKLGIGDNEVWVALVEATRMNLDLFNPYDLSGIAVSLVSAGRYNVVLFSEIAKHAMPVLPAFKAHDVGSIAWAYATAGHKNLELFDGLAQVVPPILRGFTPHGLSLTLWAFATMQVYRTEMFEVGHEAGPGRGGLGCGSRGGCSWGGSCRGGCSSSMCVCGGGVERKLGLVYFCSVVAGALHGALAHYVGPGLVIGGGGGKEVHALASRPGRARPALQFALYMGRGG